MAKSKPAKKAGKLKLKPSARDNRRYFIVSSLNAGDVSNEKIEKAILDYVGVLGMARSAYMFVKKKNEKKIVGSCSRESLNDVRASLAFYGMRIDKVSGTIKGLGA
ncbi:MAG: hypothetical protein WCP89_01490 [archaeon]